MILMYKRLTNTECKQFSMMDNFEKQKRSAVNGIDLSRKGSVDTPIQPLIQYINEEQEYFTTSSCSGRIIVFDDVNEDDHESDVYVKKKGCKWLLTSHDYVSEETVINSLDGVTGDAVFKFEPFVLHVQCKSLERAQQMLSIAVASGFRNSGISIGKKGKTLVAVRSTHTMEVPLTHHGTLLVTQEYIKFLVELANKKMKENFRRIERFFVSFTELCSKNSKDKNNSENSSDSTKIKNKQRDTFKYEKRTTEERKDSIKNEDSEDDDNLRECFLFQDQSVT